MKLKTTISKSGVVMIDSDNNFGHQDAFDMRHDAAAAHAYNEALEIVKLDVYQDEEMQSVHLQAIADVRKFAKLKMAEWGFVE